VDIPDGAQGRDIAGGWNPHLGMLSATGARRAFLSARKPNGARTSPTPQFIWPRRIRRSIAAPSLFALYWRRQWRADKPLVSSSGGQAYVICRSPQRVYAAWAG
jgi:hypothetical protein